MSFNSSKWKCVNRRMAKKFGDHFIFVNESGQVAFADHSIENPLDPSTTDHGLLIWRSEEHTSELQSH